MASILNADTSNGLKITSDTSGELKIQSAGADIATVSSTGIAMASGKTLPAAFKSEKEENINPFLMFKVFNMFENFSTIMTTSFDDSNFDRFSLLDIKTMH